MRAAAGFKSDVRVVNLSRDAGRGAPGKSVLGVLGLGVKGHTIRITAQGEGADEAVRKLADMVEAGLGEVIGG